MTPARPAILLFGPSGQIGWELRRSLSLIGRVVAPDRADAEFTDLGQLRSVVRTTRPDLVVNAVAYTRTDDAEGEPDLVRLINADAPTALAEESARLGVPFIHYSSDYVYDGRATRPYPESAPPGPLNVYGETKLAGDLGIRAVGGPHLIFRTSWVYGARGSNFLRTIRRLARERPALRVVSDQRGAPTWSRAVADATTLVASRMRTDSGFVLDEARWGVYHLSAGGETTWYDFACAILRDDPAAEEQLCREIRPVTSEEWAAPARRPRYSVLDNSRLRSTFGVTLSDWKEQLDLVTLELAEVEASLTRPARR